MTTKKTLESDIQSAIRLHVSRCDLGTLFRANVGQAWVGDRVYDTVRRQHILINIRPFKTGLPVGFSDLFGFNNDAHAVFVEVKTKTGRLRPEQEHFIKQMQAKGAYAGVARSAEDAEKIILGGKE